MSKMTGLSVSFISLVKHPANMKDIVVKAADKYNHESTITVKKSDPKGLIYGTVYKANEVDAHGHWTDIDVIRNAAHKFMQKGLYENVDTAHNKERSGAVIVESYVTDQEWNVVIKCDPASEVFQKVQKGDYQGLSLMGIATLANEECPSQKSDMSEMQALSNKVNTLETSQQQILDLVKKLVDSVNSIPRSRQIHFDVDGKAKITDADDSEALSEFKLLEVN